MARTAECTGTPELGWTQPAASGSAPSLAEPKNAQSSMRAP